MNSFKDHYYQMKHIKPPSVSTKTKTKYVFFVDDQAVRDNYGVITINAYGPKQAVTIFKKYYPKYKYNDVDVHEYGAYLKYVEQGKKRVVLDKPKTPNPNLHIQTEFGL